MIFLCSGQEIFCKSCYGKEFGPKGYGYGQGAGTLSMDAGTKGWARNNAPLSEAMYAHKYLGGNECGRCGGSVYSAEEVLGAGLVYLYIVLCFSRRIINVTFHFSYFILKAPLMVLFIDGFLIQYKMFDLRDNL